MRIPVTYILFGAILLIAVSGIALADETVQPLPENWYFSAVRPRSVEQIGPFRTEENCNTFREYMVARIGYQRVEYSACRKD